MRKLLRLLIIILLSMLALVVLFVVASIGPVDRSPAQQHASYRVMMQRLDSLRHVRVPPSTRSFSAGFSKVNCTPSFKTATAGYGNRRGKLFTAVQDSIYVRALVLDAGAAPVAIVSADLLIIPPTVTRLLSKKLQGTGFTLDNVYLGATHTHNSIGNWGEGATRFIYGAYNDSIVHFITDKIVASIVMAAANRLPAELNTGTVAIPQPVENRLISEGPEDPLLRVLEIRRKDNTSLLLMTYNAHATCLYSSDLSLSRDYPGKLVDTVESAGYDLAIFMAGAVGSHKCNPPEYGPGCIDWMAGEILQGMLASKQQWRSIADSTLIMKRVELELTDPQVKISENWKVRSWLFRSAFGEYPAHLTTLRIGDLLMLGTPCDFSGEFNPALDSVAAKHGLTTMVTGFNGGYIGYVTPGKYYDIKHYETQLMNWYAPGTGEYLSECLKKMIIADR